MRERGPDLKGEDLILRTDSSIWCSADMDDDSGDDELLIPPMSVCTDITTRMTRIPNGLPVHRTMQEFRKAAGLDDEPSKTMPSVEPVPETQPKIVETVQNPVAFNNDWLANRYF